MLSNGFRPFILSFFFRNIFIGVLYSKMHFWAWSDTLFGWYFAKHFFLTVLVISCVFYNWFFPEMVVQDDQSTTKKCTHLLIRCPTIYFIILPLVLRCLQVSKEFQPFTISNCPTYFSILPLVFSRCSTFFNIMCFNVFHQFFIPFFSGTFQKAFSIQKCTSGAGFDRLPFFGRFCYTYCTVRVFFYNYVFPEISCFYFFFPIKEKYTYLSFRRTTKRNIVLHTYAGCCQYQSQQFGWSMTWLTGGPPKIDDGQNKLWKKKRVNLLQLHDYTGKKQLWQVLGPSNNDGKTKVQITSGKIWTLTGKTLITEKRRPFVFFHNSVGDHNGYMLDIFTNTPIIYYDVIFVLVVVVIAVCFFFVFVLSFLLLFVYT